MTGRPALEGKRVLVVEDDYYAASDTAAIVQGCGATVVGCTPDADEARGLIERETIDLAVVDINLGHGPAFDTARALRQHQVPFLFATGYDAAAIPPEFRTVQRLEKPFDSRKLLDAIERLIETSAIS